MNSKRHSLSQKGFTLVELLIVIVIIGILAGVVIGVLNPIQQQNRARDAGLRAQVDKMALSTKSLYASSPRNVNRAPTPQEFAAGLANITAGHNCTGTDVTATENCRFQLTGVGLPLAAAGSTLSCEASPLEYTGAGAVGCQWIYAKSPTTFTIAGKGFAAPAQVFVYTYQENAADGTVTEGFWACPTTFRITAATSLPDLSGCTRTN